MSCGLSAQANQTGGGVGLPAPPPPLPMPMTSYKNSVRRFGPPSPLEYGPLSQGFIFCSSLSIPLQDLTLNGLVEDQLLPARGLGPGELTVGTIRVMVNITC